MELDEITILHNAAGAELQKLSVVMAKNIIESLFVREDWEVVNKYVLGCVVVGTGKWEIDIPTGDKNVPLVIRYDAEKVCTTQNTMLTERAKEGCRVLNESLELRNTNKKIDSVKPLISSFS